MSHTQGPWTIKRDELCISHYGDPTYEIKAPGPIGRMTYREDADLVSAAPDLLEACKLFERWGDNSTMDDPPEHPTLGEVTEAIMNAIAKAEGKNP